MGMVVGGDKAWKMKHHGELVVAFHWVGSQGAEQEPALCLFPRYPAPGAGVVIIGLSAAYKYADAKTGEPTEYLLHQTIPFAQHMGMILTSGLLRKIADAIVDELPELVAMPPEPTTFELERRAAEARVGEMDIKVDGELMTTVAV